MVTPLFADLGYLINVYGSAVVDMDALWQSIPIQGGLLDGFSLTVVSDVTTPGIAQVTRTVTVSLVQPPTISVNNPPVLAPVRGLAPRPYAWTGQIFSSSAEDAVGGIGVQSVQVNDLDLAGNPHSEVVNLDGQTPVDMVNGDKSEIVDVAFVSSGSFTTSKGQLTILGDPVLPPNPTQSRPLVAVVPPSYFVLAGSLTNLPDDLAQLLRGYFMAQLDMPVIALAPVLHA